MAKILFVHWQETEAGERSQTLRVAGHEVLCHSAPGGPALGSALPQAVVISLDRLPSHGYAVADWFRKTRKLQSIPLVFTAAAADRVAAACARFPGALGCGPDGLAAAVATAIGSGR